ncbi:DNA-directed DNA polymerase [Basidiobolus ranarum]|uniref:DNA-directed DNA polymerase n=1 Tax=Basidiobolus ranarum TaxID=34480 RepID=A0ABR2WZC9_9FUNG
MSTTLSLFWDLAAVDAETRQVAVKKLIVSLVSFQQAFVAEKGKEYEALLKEPVTEERLDILCAQDVSYSVKRLIRGLPTYRQGARQGFALALTELLSFLDFIPVKVITELIFKHSEITGNMKGQEERDILFGRIFGFMAIIQSGMIARETTELADIQELIKNLVEYSSTKSYLREPCYQLVIAMLPHVQKLSFKDEAVNLIISETLKNGLKTPEEIDLVLAMQPQFSLDWAALLPQWKHGDVLHSSNLQKLALILKESSSEEPQLFSSWHSHLHSVWKRILSLYLDSNQEASEVPTKKSKKSKAAPVATTKRAPFPEFWKTVVDEGLFSATSSHERKYWGFLVFEEALPRLPSTQMPLIFTANFMRCFINNLTSGDRFLNKSAKHTMDVILKVAETNTDVAFALVMQLQGKYGSQQFDKFTKTKAVETILGSMDAKGVVTYITYLKNVFTNDSDSSATEDDRVKGIEAQRFWAIDQLFALVRNTRIPREESWLLSILQFFLVHSFFEVNKVSSKSDIQEVRVKPTPNISEPTRELCRKRFFSMLAELSRIPPLSKVSELSKENGSVRISKRLNGTMNDGEFWAYVVVQMVLKLERDSNVSSVYELTPESVAARKKALDTVKKIKEQLGKLEAEGDKQADSQFKAFELLFLFPIVQLLVEPKEATGVLEELQDCYQRVFAPKKPKSKKKKAVEEEESEPEPIEVLVDILLSFLAKPSVMLRSLTEQVFETFCDRMTKTALDLLLSILETKEDVSGQQELFEDDVEEMDEDEEDSSEEESDEESDLEDAVEDDEEVDEELRAKLAAAFGQKEGEESEEELLGDEEMGDFDAKLAEIFKHKKMMKAEKRDAKQSILHFKNKILDLLEIFIKKQPQNELLLELIIPLLRFVRNSAANTANKQAGEKATNLLKNKLVKVKDHPKISDTANALETLEAVHQFARKAPNSTMMQLFSHCSLFLVRVIIGNEDKKSTEKVVDIYKASLNDYMTRKSSNLQPAFFLDLLNRYPVIGWGLFKSLIELTKPSVSAKGYREAQAYNMLSTLIRSHIKDGEDIFTKCLPSLKSTVLSTLEFAVSKENQGSKTLNAARLKDVLKFINLVQQASSKKLKDDKFKKAWDTVAFEKAIKSLVADKRFESPSIRTLSQQILTRLGRNVDFLKNTKN